ncbi:MAG: tRNA glutamyl-Q(34) synthetase GluQRS [Gemmataceae bacterium]
MIVGRLAPSPTGAQHVGNARTYLLAWLSARSRGGQLRLRLEDIDSPRVKPGAAQQALEDLRWLGLDWDGPVVVQSRDLRPYEAALAQLRSTNRVYACTCTRGDIERAASAPHAEHEGPIYPGTCAHRHAGEVPDRPHCWRYRLPAQTPQFTDRFQGPVALDLHELGGDFVVWKAARPPHEAASPAYQLAVVVDDAAMGITEVVRGDDLIPSTPRQLLLYEALGWSTPMFVHVPLVVGPDGRRLAKRHGDTRLAALREAGVEPEALVGLLAKSCGLGDGRPISPRELLPSFTWDRLPRGAFVLSQEHLARIGYRQRQDNA